MAKLFKVYCYEYSIGMGPLIFKKKKKSGETQFSIRALPIGGYVSMAGDEEAEKDRTNAEVAKVPKERTIAGVSWWKQIIIFVAGVFVNFVLGFVFFFISYVLCSQPNYGSSKVKIVEDSKLISETVKVKDIITITLIRQVVTINGVEHEVYIDDNGEKVSTYQVETYDEISYVLNVAASEEYKPTGKDDFKTMYFTYITKDNVKESATIKISAIKTGEGKLGVEIYSWDKIGFSVTMHHLGFVEGLKQACRAWGEGTIALFKAIGMLFTPAGWQQAGGIISVFRMSEMAASSGAGVFFNYWGLISVNLAIFNLLPVPGLDGWQILVAIVEGAAHKKIPNKVKNIVSYIGLGILFILMIVLIVKDIFFPSFSRLIWMI